MCRRIVAKVCAQVTAGNCYVWEYVGKDYSQRKQWVIERLAHLADISRSRSARTL